MWFGCKRAREAKTQTCRRECEELRLKADESIEDLAIYLTTIVSNLELLGDPVDEYKAVIKYLRIVPRKYRMMAMAIEQTVNLREMTIKELTGRFIFITAEEGYKLDDATDGLGKLLLKEEEWATHAAAPARQQRRQYQHQNIAQVYDRRRKGQQQWKSLPRQRATQATMVRASPTGAL
ncbi:hypothetical protein QYE76_005530 [Lolium multiflorum]|uniref:Uncharacterized protein n=1 Tax=Lolium multiflorum TaxID=4521 RepID=A0AAD8W0U3_LOLMU|nr:hypothetical protein QYE76_005530 [Lolium multiflorum]